MMNWPSWLTTQAHIGSQYPYYSIEENLPSFSLNFNDVYLSVSNTDLDVQAVIEILMRSYIIGDKSLIKSVKRTPWMAEYDEEKNNWQYYDIPPHDNKKMDPKEAAIKLKEILYEEVLKYVGETQKVGILLSGGMDSRILAGVLREAQLNRDFNGQVIAYNWGMFDSRDVWYAKKIAEEYDWDYKHFSLNPEVLKENFYLVQKVGAETLPYNLHAMDAVAQDADSDIILAGSYGDTMGRAEYNGIPLQNVPPVVPDKANKLGLLKDSIVQQYYEKIENESKCYRNTIDKHKREEFQYRETEYQRHHARRYLTTAMSIIAMEKPLYQVFTSPKVARFLWSLDLPIRSDVLYEKLLPLLPGNLWKIPWARTGKLFGSNDNRSPDCGNSASHKYGKWLRNDLRGFIDEELDLNKLSSLGIFNEKSLEKIYKNWSSTQTDSIDKIDTTISWLTSFSMFIKEYDVKRNHSYSKNYKDILNDITISPKIKAYQYLRNKRRN
ncbi:hypothetical protein GCM10007063_16990 [Lentibacillus kapialis]|uniref:asparagine synthase (glutamine-hydrolyzing) n=1 Tax=Lentibacillus kapialis TaxID=340214 RepID=A0A917PWB8_9BACI|nr:asparagine synthase-related protein [Lentibacillus kapialis]GGJ95059.1 hypothetical protein GCM10007063_16990 [Lentibacillus kapialis]